MSAQFPLRLHRLLPCFLALLASLDAYTYEPPGRDPASIDKIRSAEKSTILTSENFDELTSGKTVFLKFFSPYCPHCQGMADAWNQLATYYQESSNDDVLIGSIDCTNSPDGKALCARFKIVGLPTLLYGDASLGGVYLEEYGGDKSFQDLKAFASETLVPTCTPGNLGACSPEVRGEMEMYMAMPYRALDARIKGMEKSLEEINTHFASVFEHLQKKHDSILMRKELHATRAKANLKLIKEVLAMKKQ